MGTLGPLFPGGGRLLLGAALGRPGLPEVEEPRFTGAQGCVGQGPWAGQPLLGHVLDCLPAASARVRPRQGEWWWGRALVPGQTAGSVVSCAPWLGRSPSLLSLSFLVCGGSHAPTPGAVRAEGLRHGAGLPLYGTVPRMGRMGLIIVPESVPGRPICP